MKRKSDFSFQEYFSARDYVENGKIKVIIRNSINLQQLSHLVQEQN